MINFLISVLFIFIIGVTAKNIVAAIPEIPCTKIQLEAAKDFIAVCNLTNAYDDCFVVALKTYCGKANTK